MVLKFIIAAIALFCWHPPGDRFPAVEISNGIIHAKLFLPDSAIGYYRGARFDQSGVMPQLECNGHSYFGKWFEKYDPLNHDAIMGPVEEFTPVGFNEAREGEPFLKIGVGMLTKKQDSTYFFSAPYTIVNRGNWKVAPKADQVAFIQTSEDSDYAYEYEKIVRLEKGKPAMVIAHTLENTGKLPIASRVYDHNFFVMDEQPTGPGITVSFNFQPNGDAGKTASFGNLEENKIIFTKEFLNNDHLQYRSLTGFTNAVNDYDIRIENHKTGAAVRITSDQPLAQLAFWSAKKTVCPEPYIQFNIKPGETFTWKIFYQFYQCERVER